MSPIPSMSQKQASSASLSPIEIASSLPSPEHSPTIDSTPVGALGSHPPLQYTQEYIAFLNEKLAPRSPEQILEWALITLPGLVQTTAFGLTGLVILDMISKIRSRWGLKEHPVPLVFIDTLYHFPETLALATQASSRYQAHLHTFYPSSHSTLASFESTHGPNLWQTNPQVYDYLVKVEPARRAALALNAQTLITGRRRSQGHDRAEIPVLEVDASGDFPLLKLNVLAAWGFDAVWNYVKENGVPYNALLDRGYKSVGDWHSTVPVGDGQGERAGRWKGTEKTECGLHRDYFVMKREYLKGVSSGAREGAEVSVG